MASATSASDSPTPTIRLLLVKTSGRSRFALRSTSRLWANEARGSRTWWASRGTHPTVWAKTATGRPAQRVPQRGHAPRQIARQEFDGDLRQPPMHGLDAALVVRAATVGQVVAVHHGDHDVLEMHPLDRVGQVLGLRFVGRLGGAERLNAAEATAAGTRFAGDHEGGRAAGPAVVDVGATGLFADRVQFLLGDGVLRRVEDCQRGAARQVDAQALGQPRALARSGWIDGRKREKAVQAWNLRVLAD